MSSELESLGKTLSALIFGTAGLLLVALGMGALIEDARWRAGVSVFVGLWWVFQSVTKLHYHRKALWPACRAPSPHAPGILCTEPLNHGGMHRARCWEENRLEHRAAWPVESPSLRGSPWTLDLGESR